MTCQQGNGFVGCTPDSFGSWMPKLTHRESSCKKKLKYIHSIQTCRWYTETVTYRNLDVCDKATSHYYYNDDPSHRHNYVSPGLIGLMGLIQFITHRWWCHQMEIFFCVTGLFVRGIHGSTVNSPHKGQWRGALMFSLICAWINGSAINSEAGDLRRHCAHYDVTVIIKTW